MERGIYMDKRIKLILTIKQKCDMIIHVKGYDKNKNPIWYEDLSDCHRCNGTGEQEKKIYALRDFECRRTPRKFRTSSNGAILIHEKSCSCNGTGYIIPKEY